MGALTERSAGVILYQRPAGGVGGERFLLLVYGKYWDYAKGHVETGEDDLAAARREVMEETGIDGVEIDATFRHEIGYFFRGKKGLIHKTVVFFLGRSVGDAVTLSHEHAGYAWLGYEGAFDRLTYASAKNALRAARDHLATG